MSTLRPWAVWRRLQYGSGFLLMVGLVSGLTYYQYFYHPGDCFDAVMNEDETGVDCGGTCVRICAASVIPPTIIWADSFKINEGQYNAVAYVENKNPIAGTPALKYTFELYDGSTLVAKREGTTLLPPNSVYAIFEGRIFTDGKKVTNTKLTLQPAELWQPAPLGREQFKTSNLDLISADKEPRLRATIENIELKKAEKIEVVATLFNDAGKAVTASQTFIDGLEGRSSKDIVFTWPGPIAKTIKSCIIPTDVLLVLDRSGSMAADGGNPPQPLESAKDAAKSFTKLLKAEDTMGYLSYATMPTTPLEQQLTADLSQVEAAIAGTMMGTNGVQYTNMGEAFKSATTELISERHRPDARKAIVFMTDGDVTRPLNPQTNLQDREYAATYAQEQALKAKDAGVTIYAIGFGNFLKAANSDVSRDTSLIRSFASEPANYYEAPTVTDLEIVYRKIASSLCESGTTRIDVIAKTPTNFTPLR